MSRRTFVWGIPRYQVKSKERWLEIGYFLNLWVGAIVLYTVNLGKLPLRDWDEGTVAQVAKEIYQNSFQDWHWLFPTFWGEPYFNKPPLIHSLTAIAYSVFGVTEFSTRIVGASLTALSVPLLYLVAKELFVPRYYALFSALIYLTMLPVVRHGRLAMLDGGILCFYILLLLCVLKTRRDLRWSYPAGLSLTLICLCKGWMMGVLLGGIVFLFVLWDTPRLITSVKAWCGFVLGLAPGISWYAAQYLYYGQQFIDRSIDQQSLARVFSSVEGNQGPVWYYALELLKYPYPWIFFGLLGLRYARKNLNWSWARLILVTTVCYFIAVSLMGTKLPWYIMPIYPTLSLSAGAIFARVRSLPFGLSYPLIWKRFFAFLAIVLGGGLIFMSINQPDNYNLLTVLGLLFITFLSVAVLLDKKDKQYISILFWGMYITLVVFCSSDYWLWELNEAFAVKPVAQAIVKNIPTSNTVYIDFDYHRPSLDFYSERKIIPVNGEQIAELLKTPSSLTLQPLILQQETIEKTDFIYQNSLYCYDPQGISPQKEQLISEIHVNCWQKIDIQESKFSILLPISRNNET